MTQIVETKFGTLMDPARVAKGSASSITKKGAFFVFSIRVSPDDVREYSFTDRRRAEHMRAVLISHLENRIKGQAQKTA